MEEQGSVGNSRIDISNLTNAIVQCFSIILLGYAAGRTEVISSVHAAGIGRFVSRFCLPALIFRSMCLLDFSVVNWTFLIGVSLAKISLFALVSVATLLVKRPFNLGLAGIFSIFAIQSNDFAFGYPIVDAIYHESHPDYVNYLYLLAPVTLAVLVPIGFIMMEFQKTINLRGEGQNASFRKAFVSVAKGVALNPIVSMTMIGLLANFILGGSLPAMLDNIFIVLGQAFNAGALFFLGLSLVGKIQGKLGIGLLVPFLLVTAKTLVLPLFAWGILQRLDTSKNSTSFSMYGFLYGTIPTAPSLYIFASDFGFGQETIATALVLGNALSAPFMFVSAKMMTVMVDSGQDFKALLYDTSYNFSIISFVGCLWVMSIFIITGRWKRVPHRFTMAYMLSHMIACVGLIIFHSQGDHTEDHTWHRYPSMVLLMTGVLASRFWTAIMAFALCMLHVRSLCAVLRLQFWFYFVGFGIPMVMTGLQFILANHTVDEEINPSFHYGTCQAIFSLSALLVCFAVTVTSLVWWQREESLHHTVQQRQGEGSTASMTESPSQLTLLDEDEDKEDLKEINSSEGTSYSFNAYGDPSVPEVANIEDILPFPEASFETGYSESVMENLSERTCLRSQCSTEQRHACMNRLRNYTRTSLNVAYVPVDENEAQMSAPLQMMQEYQSVHHLILLLPLIFSMFVAVLLCTWKIMRGRPTGIYIEVEFLDIVLNYGQGILVALVFGFESKLIFSPVIRRLRRLVFGAEIMQLPVVSELDEKTKQTCNQFTKYHMENCRKEIVRDRRFRTRTLNNVFTGTAMCDWLIQSGLATDRSSAVEYGCHLILGRVITHITSEQNFHDVLYFYKFVGNYEQLPV